MDIGALAAKAKESGAIDKAVDAAVGSKDKVVSGIGSIADQLGLDAATKDAALKKVEAALGDSAGLKSALNAQVDKAAGGASPAAP